MADSRNLSLALRAIRGSDVRFGIVPSQSGVRENDEIVGWHKCRTLTPAISQPERESSAPQAKRQAQRKKGAGDYPAR